MYYTVNIRTKDGIKVIEGLIDFIVMKYKEFQAIDDIVITKVTESGSEEYIIPRAFERRVLRIMNKRKEVPESLLKRGNVCNGTSSQISNGSL